MGIEKVKEEVLAKARKQSSAILAEAKKEADEIIRNAEKKAEERRKKTIDEAERELSEAKTRELSSAELEAMKMLLEAKKRIIENAFEEAIQTISKYPASTRKQHIKSLINKAKSQIEISKILCNEKDIKNIEGYMAFPTETSGGIIAENKDRTIRVDYSYDAILSKTREETLKDVAKILFQE